MPARFEFEGRWECTHGTSNKFYEIHRITDNDFHCEWGPIGRASSSIRYSYDRVMKKVRDFRKKHYRQVGAGVRPNEDVIEATPHFEPPDTNARLSAVDEEELIITNDKPKDKPKKKFVPVGRLSSIGDD